MTNLSPNWGDIPSRTKEEWGKVESFVIKYLMPMQGTRTADRRLMRAVLNERGKS